MSNQNNLNSSIDHLFRHEYAKIVSYLTAKFGAAQIDFIEDAVQDALYKAMQLWSYQDMPPAPGKWLYQTAHNGLIDKLRRNAKSVTYEPATMNNATEATELPEDGILKDEELRMIFACCHPSMKEQEQIMLSLKLLCGFSNLEIARALFKSPDAVKKALTRAKQKFKSEVGHLEIPSKVDLKERMSVVLKVLYLLFNNGYTAYDGKEVLKKDVCEEAIRLTGLLYEHAISNTPETSALLSLMCFNFSRFNAREDAEGNLLTLEQQNWEAWDQALIGLGLRFLEESAVGENISKYHFEAAIAYEYACSKSFESIKWHSILNLYDILSSYYYSPNIALNRLVVFEKVKSAKAALTELNKLSEKSLLSNHLYYAIKGDFEKKLGLTVYAQTLKKAIELTANQKEKAFLREKMNRR